MAVQKYVLNHGGLALAIGEEYEDGVGKKRRRTVHLRPSADPLKPTIVELTADEAAKVNGHAWDVDAKKHVRVEPHLLINATDDGDCLIPLAEWEAEQAAKAAAVKAKAEVLEKHAKAKDEKKGGGK